MADMLRLLYGLVGSYSLFGSDTFLFRKCFKRALFYIIIGARPISEFGVQPAIELEAIAHAENNSKEAAARKVRVDARRIGERCQKKAESSRDCSTSEPKEKTTRQWEKASFN